MWVDDPEHSPHAPRTKTLPAKKVRTLNQNGHLDGNKNPTGWHLKICVRDVGSSRLSKFVLREAKSSTEHIT
ncbi:hypothetical protein WAI453_012203 [Rhynchosporium graminicola]